MAKITAVICTYNRAGYLETTLLSLVNQTLPKSDYLVLVIDNASADQTKTVVDSFQTQLNISYIFEPRIGLSLARNRGISVCKTRYISFLDDDAVASPEWLEKILLAFEKSTPHPVIVGGRVLLEWNKEKPDWIPDKFLSLYSILDYDDKSRFLLPSEYVVGANISFEIDFLREAGGFSTSLGRKGKNLLSGEETKVLELARSRQLGIYYEALAFVKHQVVPERKKRNWLVRRVFWDGASQPLLDYGYGQSRIFYIHHALYNLRQAALNFFLSLFSGKQNPDSIWICVQRFGKFYMNLILLMTDTSKKTS